MPSQCFQLERYGSRSKIDRCGEVDWRRYNDRDCSRGARRRMLTGTRPRNERLLLCNRKEGQRARSPRQPLKLKYCAFAPSIPILLPSARSQNSSLSQLLNSLATQSDLAHSCSAWVQEVSSRRSDTFVLQLTAAKRFLQQILVGVS